MIGPAMTERARDYRNVQPKHTCFPFEVGERIPDSYYYRAYCRVCGEPIRVPMDENGIIPEWGICMHCRPERDTKRSIAASQDQFSPYQEKAIRDLEEARAHRFDEDLD